MGIFVGTAANQIFFWDINSSQTN
jgi:mRNA export factor